MLNYAGTYKGVCSYNLVYNFLTQFLPLQSLVFEVYFPNAFWHRNEAFPRGSSYNEIVPLLVIFQLPYSKYRNVKMCFYSCRYQNQIFFTRVTLVSFMQKSCRTCVVRVAVVSHFCRTLVTRVSLVLHSCRTQVARVWHSCCKLDQI